MQQITDVGIRLFSLHGFEGTTLDMIAADAGISRRTFFHYFTSKEEILLAWQNALPDRFHGAILRAHRDQSPLETLRDALLALEDDYSGQRSPAQRVLLFHIMQSSEQLRATQHIKHQRMQAAAQEALSVLWPEPERQLAHRIAAMIAVGVLQIALERWSAEHGREPLANYLTAGFEAARISVQG
nr:TetR/AcrR family transcriptional regulator [Pseudomonas oryzihabitans]